MSSQRAPVQVVAGDIAARFVALNEPAKFAAMEAVYHTRSDAPITIGGIPSNDRIVGAIEIPELLSVLVGSDPKTVITGFDRIEPDDRPPVAATHLSFDTMVGSATLLTLIVLGWLATIARTEGAGPDARRGHRTLRAAGTRRA
jgi:cytochrome d ubiquinol oxidase subunit I